MEGRVHGLLCQAGCEAKLYTYFGIHTIGSCRLAKQKTSVYVEKELWERFRSYAHKRGLEVSRILEDVMEEEMLEEQLEQILREMIGPEAGEVDFDRIKPKMTVSELVRTLRHERTSRLLGQ